MKKFLENSERKGVVDVNRYGVPYVRYVEVQENQPSLLSRIEVFLFAVCVATISFLPRCKFAIKNFFEKVFLI